MSNLKIALEYERGLHFADFTIANLALNFLDHPYNTDKKGEPVFHKEGTLHQNEFNSKPHASISSLAEDLLESESTSGSISKNLGVYNIPISETGAGEGIINPDVQYRTDGYKVIFGQEALDELIKISGIHIHIDQYKPRLVDQFNALTALRPAIALMSSSSVSYQRKNGVNCHRYKLISDPEEGVFAKIPENNCYISSIEELKQRDVERYEAWLQDFSENCEKHGLTVDYFLDNFGLENTGYPDIRYRPDMGVGTFELRTDDTNTYENVIAKAALVLGYMNNIINNKIPVNYTKIDGEYAFSDGQVLLPNEDTLRHYTALGGQHGLEKSENNDYLREVVDFATKGLPKNQQNYLLPHEKMLDSGKNVASEILAMLGHKGPYSKDESAMANKYMHMKQIESVEFLKEVQHV